MIDVPKQTAYWRDGALEELEVAGELLRGGRYRHALFFAHLGLEKMLKAHVTRRTEDLPPRIHNLSRLAERIELQLSAEQRNFLNEFNAYQLEGRYPEHCPVNLDAATASQDLARAMELVKWLKAQL
jgi:HEPN domain-containing protein